MMELSQSAHHLSGTAQLEVDGSSVGLVIDGDIRDAFVSIQMRSRSAKRIAYTMLLCQVVGTGDILSGHAVFYDTGERSLRTEPVLYKRLAD